MGATTFVASPIAVVWTISGARHNVAIWEGDGGEREGEWGGYLIDRKGVWVGEGPRSDGGHVTVSETKGPMAEWSGRWGGAEFVT